MLLVLKVWIIKHFCTSLCLHRSYLIICSINFNRSIFYAIIIRVFWSWLFEYSEIILGNRSRIVIKFFHSCVINWVVVFESTIIIFSSQKSCIFTVLVTSFMWSILVLFIKLFVLVSKFGLHTSSAFYFLSQYLYKIWICIIRVDGM